MDVDAETRNGHDSPKTLTSKPCGDKAKEDEEDGDNAVRAVADELFANEMVIEIEDAADDHMPMQDSISSSSSSNSYVEKALRRKDENGAVPLTATPSASSSTSSSVNMKKRKAEGGEGKVKAKKAKVVAFDLGSESAAK
ncbi:hypothetical protein H0H93_003790, partial [Arthromyces matolae]